MLTARLDKIVVHQNGGLAVLADALPAQQQETERLVQQNWAKSCSKACRS
ncbi:hypothetical protein PCI56_21285 [Plesiomonas shigelloides subsp. oncorhynchi]|nr:hypothetical protein [Plesiomonas shigelloides]